MSPVLALMHHPAQGSISVRLFTLSRICSYSARTLTKSILYTAQTHPVYTAPSSCLTRPVRRSCFLGSIHMEPVKNSGPELEESGCTTLGRPPVRIDGKITKEYAAFCSMRARCLHTSKAWKERCRGTIYENGMELQPEWHSPAGYGDFYQHVGPAPVNTLLDRVENNKGYVKGNLRWATQSVSNMNKRNARMITANGETLNASEWSRRTGLSLETILNRLNKQGLTEQEAVTRPLQHER